MKDRFPNAGFNRLRDASPIALFEVLGACALDKIMGLVRIPKDLTPTEPYRPYNFDFRVEAPVTTEDELLDT